MGYEFQIDIDSNPMRIEFLGESNDNNYYVFCLNEQVYFEGSLSHVNAIDYFAVHIKTNELRIDASDLLFDNENGALY